MDGRHASLQGEEMAEIGYEGNLIVDLSWTLMAMPVEQNVQRNGWDDGCGEGL